MQSFADKPEAAACDLSLTGALHFSLSAYKDGFVHVSDALQVNQNIRSVTHWMVESYRAVVG